MSELERKKNVDVFSNSTSVEYCELIFTRKLFLITALNLKDILKF